MPTLVKATTAPHLPLTAAASSRAVVDLLRAAWRRGAVAALTLAMLLVVAIFGAVAILRPVSPPEAPVVAARAQLTPGSGVT